MNYFELFGIAPALQVDASTLKRRFFELQRQYHPDHAQPNDGEAAAQAMEMTARINAAWKTFCDADALIKYVLEGHGLMIADEKYNLPSQFLMTVMELNEQKMDGADPADIQRQTAALQRQIFEEVSTLLVQYHPQTTTPAELERIKRYYFQKKYLDRLQAE
jgi:molecular chaperone HscB